MLPKSHRQLWGTDFPIGGEWDAGVANLIGPADQGGRWTVRREENRFVEFFHIFKDRSEVVLAIFDPTEEGEIEAKTTALADRESDSRTP